MGDTRYYVESILPRFGQNMADYKTEERARFPAAHLSKDCSHAIIWKCDLSRPGESERIATYVKGSETN